MGFFKKKEEESFENYAQKPWIQEAINISIQGLLETAEERTTLSLKHVETTRMIVLAKNGIYFSGSHSNTDYPIRESSSGERILYGYTFGDKDYPKLSNITLYDATMSIIKDIKRRLSLRIKEKPIVNTLDPTTEVNFRIYSQSEFQFCDLNTGKIKRSRNGNNDEYRIYLTYTAKNCNYQPITKAEPVSPATISHTSNTGRANKLIIRLDLPSYWVNISVGPYEIYLDDKFIGKIEEHYDRGGITNTKTFLVENGVHTIKCLRTYPHSGYLPTNLGVYQFEVYNQNKSFTIRIEDGGAGRFTEG